MSAIPMKWRGRRDAHLLPLEADLEVVVELDEVEQVPEDRVRLVLRHAHDALREVRVHEHGLPARHGVRPIIVPYLISMTVLGMEEHERTHRMTG